MVEIQITKKTDQKYMMEWQDKDGVNCGVSLLLVQEVIINHETGVLDVYQYGYNVFTSTANKLVLAIDLMGIGDLFDVYIETEGQYTKIKVEFLNKSLKVE